MSLEDPPARLECNSKILREGLLVHRLHDRKLASDGYNPGFGETRFAPCNAKAGPIPTLYAATSYDCAVHEYIFHNIDPAEEFKSVLWSEIEPVDYSILRLTRDLQLVQLFNPDLMKWGIDRRQLIDTPRSDWPQTRLWSAAVHDAHDWVEGMIWTSKRYDEEQAMILFGDRAGASFEVVSQVSITTDPPALTRLHELAKRSNIDIIR